MKETLSDKRIELIGFEEDEGRDKYQYDEVDVREFIKNIKADLRKLKYPFTYDDIIEILNKRAGPELT